MLNIMLAITLALAATVTALPECPPEGSTMFFILPHESDCTKFYICSHGTPILQTCPEGTHFNAIFMVCQNPVFAGCDSSPPESELPCTWPDNTVHRPHPDSCSKFYVCEFGVAQIFECPQGTEFNAELQECVWPHESNCNISQYSPEDVDSQDGGCQSGALSKHEECGKYYVCDHGANVAMDCANGLQWSSKLEQCVWPHESDCGHEEQPDPEQDGGLCEEGALSASEECSKYNICNHGALVAQDCPAGLQWNSKLTQCVWPHESDCGHEEQPDAEQDGGQDDTQDGGLCEEGALSASKDCSKYNICSHGALVAVDCPAGLHWNAKLSYCDWPVSAGCQ